jgi:hypothetical protein
MDNGTQVYGKAEISLQDIPVDLVYYPVSKESYVLSWKMQYHSPKNGILYQSYVDAASGTIIKSDVLTIRCSFDSNYLGREYDDCDDEAAITIGSSSCKCWCGQLPCIDAECRISKSLEHWNY